MNQKRKNIGSDRPLLRNGTHYLIIQILEKEGKPMRASEITNKILERKRLTGDLPYNTVFSILHSSAFVSRVGKGMYKLVKKPTRFRDH